MNFDLVLILAALLGGACLIAALGVRLIDRGVHPAWFVAVLFVVAIAVVGVPWQQVV